MYKKIIKAGKQRLWLAHREYIREKHELSYLFWECTLNCNFKCRHCGSRAGDLVLPEVVRTPEIKNAFTDIARNFDANKITVAVTGGEPLLRKDVFEVMEYATSLGFRWGMVSNGYLWNEKTVAQARKSRMNTLEISIDGIGQVHDDFRRKEGSYKRAISAIDMIKEANFLRSLCITTTFHKGNISNLEKMYDIFSKLKIDRWRLLSVDPIGRARDENMLLDPKEMRRLLDFIKEKRKSDKTMKFTYSCAHFLGDDYEDEVRNGYFNCAAGINVASILFNGDIFVCPNVERKPDLIQGNIKKELFSEIWKNKFTFFRKKERITCDDCRECKYWENCLGGSFHTWDFSHNRPKICLINWI